MDYLKGLTLNLSENKSQEDRSYGRRSIQNGEEVEFLCF